MNLLFAPDEKSSYDYSLSNLLMLKLFHDAGVDVQKFSDFITDINYNSGTNLDIFIDGLKALYPNLNCIEPYDEPETIEDLEEKKVIPHTPEKLIILKDEKIERLFQSALLDEFCTNVIKKNNGGDFCEFEILANADYGLLVCLYWDGFLHEVVENLLNITNQVDTYLTKIEGL